MVERSHRTKTEAVFDTLIEEQGALIRNTIVRLCPKDLGIQFDDVEQEVRLRLWRGIQAERQIHDLPSYIYRIAVTATIDAIRQAKARREDQLRLSGDKDGPPRAHEHLAARRGDSPDRVAEHRLLIEKIDQVLDSLPVNRRRVVGLHLQGMTTTEIAELMDWTEPKARNLLHRGFKEFRKRLCEAGIDYEGD